MQKREPTREELFAKIRTLEERLWEAEQTIQAIQSGEVDALVIRKPAGEQIYTLTGADHGYRVLVESITEGALILSSDDSIYYCNRTLGEMLGRPIQKIISRKLDSYAAPEAQAQLLELIKESRTHGAARGESLMQRNEGTLLPVNVSFNRMSLGDFEGVCAVITDLSEQKQVEEELRRHRTELEFLVHERTDDLVSINIKLQQEISERQRAEEELRRSRDELELRVRERTAEFSTAVARLELMNQELQEFTFAASHDLQEPLRKIQTFCDMAKNRCAPALDSAGQEYLERIISSAARMRQLLQDLLQISRVATKPTPFKAIDLGEIAREAARLVEESVKEAGGLVEIESLPTIEADDTQMLRLFQNLIGNALKFRGNARPRIKVSGKLDGRGDCEISVKDNGIGFDQRFAERIFKPFQRLHGRSEYEGTGIGLAICRKIVERHGGRIRVESEPGKGSTFIIRLPVKQDRWKDI
jgi:PAS domain S-box-containing protein